MTASLLVVAAAVFVAVLSGAASRGEVGYDAALYIDSARRWLETGEFYYSAQFAGPYIAEGQVMLYPPIALYLFAPFVFLPRVLWWAIPLAIIAATVWYWRPARWAWPIIAGCLALLPSSAILVYGNTDLWGGAVIALATRWPGAVALLALKPAIAPLGLLFIRQRAAWIGAVIVALACLPFGSLWLDWIAALGNLNGGSPFRSVNAIPWLAIPLVAYISRAGSRGIPAWLSAVVGRRSTSAPPVADPAARS